MLLFGRGVCDKMNLCLLSGTHTKRHGSGPHRSSDGLNPFMGFSDNKILKFCMCAWLSIIFEQIIPKLNGF